MSRTPVSLAVFVWFIYAGQLASGGSQSSAGTGALPMGIPSRLSLSAAQEIAFANNFDLVAVQANVDLAVATKIAAYEWPNPNFTFSPTKIDIHQRQGTSLGNSLADRTYDTIVAVSELFEIGKRSRRQASARAGVESARAQLEDAHRTLDLGVTKAYLAALLAEANATVLNDSAKALRKESTIAKTRLNAGDLSDSDQAQIEINADQLDLNAKSAESTAIQARIQLEVLLGDRHPDGKIELTESLESLANIPSGIVFTVPENRPDVVAAEAAVRKADYDIALAKAGRIPDLTFQTQYERNPPDPLNSVGFSFSFPLPVLNHNDGAIQSALASREIAVSQLDKTRQGVISDITTAEAAYQEARARLSRYEATVRPAARKVRDAVTFAFDRGGASLLDLLEAQRSDNDIRAATEQAEADSVTAAAALAAAYDRRFPAEMKKEGSIKK